MVTDTPGADWGFWDQFADGRWEPSTFVELDRYLRPEVTYVDVGAWIGPTVLYAAQRCRRVVALEPDPVSYAHLTQNLLANGATGVQAWSLALAPQDGPVLLHERGGWGSSMSTVLAPTGGETREVGGVSWARLVRGLDDVALVKMDIEGGEPLVIDDVAQWCVLRRVPLLVSLHAPWWRRGDEAVVEEALGVFDEVATLESSGGFSTVIGRWR